MEENTNDWRSIYYADQREKRSVASSAINSASRRSASRKHFKEYTRKEAQAMNGEPERVFLHRRYTYAELKQLPESLQIEYLRGLIAGTGATSREVGEVLECNAQTAQKLLRKLGVPLHRGGYHPHDKIAEAVKQYFGETEEAEAEETEEAEAEETEEAVETTALPSDDLLIETQQGQETTTEPEQVSDLYSTSVTLEGHLDPKRVGDLLRCLFPAGARIRVTVEVIPDD